MNYNLDFSDLTLVEIPVKLPDGKDYTLREADEEAARRYQNARFASVKLGTEGKGSSVTGMADCESQLVSFCLFDTNDRNVKLETVRKLPYRVHNQLFETIKEISELDRDDTLTSLKEQRDKVNSRIEEMEKDEVGNVQSDTTDGSD